MSLMINYSKGWGKKDYKTVIRIEKAQQSGTIQSWIESILKISILYKRETSLEFPIVFKS